MVQGGAEDVAGIRALEMVGCVSNITRNATWCSVGVGYMKATCVCRTWRGCGHVPKPNSWHTQHRP